MNAIALVTGCVCGVLAGAGMAAALARMQDTLVAAVRHRLASAAFWLTAALPFLLVCLGGLVATTNIQAAWSTAAALFSDALPAQPWLATLARCSLYAAMIAVAVGGLRLASQLWRTMRLRKALHPRADTWPPLVAANVPGPMLVGYRHPVVVLPETAKACAPGVVDALIRHERAHAVRRDNWRLLAENTALALLPWCLPLRALHRMLSAAREELCDAIALRDADDSTRIGYAEALVDALRQSARHRVLYSTMAGTMPAVRRRMAAILEPSQTMAAPRWRQCGGAGAVLLLSMLAAATAWCLGAGLETAAGLHGMSMRFAALDSANGVYRVTTLGGPAAAGAAGFAPGAYTVRFTRSASGKWIVTTAAVARVAETAACAPRATCVAYAPHM